MDGLVHAHAAQIGFEFNAGPITEINAFSSSAQAAFNGFQVGEDILISFTIDEFAIDVNPGAGGDFEDATGALSVTGLTSGTTAVITGGTRIEFEDASKFEVDALTDPTDGFGLNDTDLDLAGPTGLISDPEDLKGSIDELEALLFQQTFSGITNATTLFGALEFYEGGVEVGEIVFGPVPTQPAPVPLPAGLVLLGGGLLGLGLARRAI